MKDLSEIFEFVDEECLKDPEFSDKFRRTYKFVSGIYNLENSVVEGIRRVGSRMKNISSYALGVMLSASNYFYRN